jgi:hypothetical protein
MLAVTLGGKGEMTATAVQWQYHRAVPQLPSPLLYGGALYMINDAGIATSFDPASGEVIAQGRLPEVTDNFYASPVAGDGKVYFVSETGKVVVLPPGGRFDEAIAVNDMGDLCYATPALAEGRIYLRAGETLYCFGRARDRSGDLDQLDIVNDALARQRMIGVERD